MLEHGEGAAAARAQDRTSARRILECVRRDLHRLWQKTSIPVSSRGTHGIPARLQHHYQGLDTRARNVPSPPGTPVLETTIPGRESMAHDGRGAAPSGLKATRVGQSAHRKRGEARSTTRRLCAASSRPRNASRPTAAPHPLESSTAAIRMELHQKSPETKSLPPRATTPSDPRRTPRLFFRRETSCGRARVAEPT